MIVQVCNVFTALLFKISVYDSFASIIISEYKGFMTQVPCIMLCPHFWPLLFISALISFKTTCCFCTQPWSFSPSLFVCFFFQTFSSACLSVFTRIIPLILQTCYEPVLEQDFILHLTHIYFYPNRGAMMILWVSRYQCQPWPKSNSPEVTLHSPFHSVPM